MAVSAKGFRLLIAALAVTLVGILIVTLWRFGSTPTDENLFVQPPSAVMLTAAVPAARPPEGAAVDSAAPGLQPGDIVIAIDRTRVFTAADYRKALDRSHGTIRATVIRKQPGRETEVTADAEALRSAPFRDISRTAFVVDVTPGGASERAGMRVGDLIVSINGRPFRNIVEADAILRSGTVGHSTDYQVLRSTQALTLRVTLASFGLRLSVILFSMAGLFCLLFGASLALARPLIPAARYLGLTFVLLGFALSVSLLRRAFETGAAVLSRDIALFATLFAGLAVSLHAALYFPRSRPSLLARRWVLPIAYGLAAASTVLVFFVNRNLTVPLLIATNLLYGGFVRWLGRGDLTPESRRILRPINLTIGAVAVLVFLGLLGIARLQAGPGPDPGLAGVFLLLIPLVHLWAIGRYRLLDLNLRLRRHVQYSLVSTIWGLLPFVILVWLVLALPQMQLPIPNVRFEESSIEVLQTPIESGQRAVIEKVVLMLVAIGFAFGLRNVTRRGQQWIAGKFHRAEDDYRRAAKEVFKLVAARPDLEGLSTGLVDAVVRLLQVKRAGAVFFHQDRTYFSSKGHGFTEEEWQRISQGSADLLDGVRKAQEEVAVEYVFPRLRRLLTEVEVQYLFPLRSHDELVGALLVGEKLAEDLFGEEDFEFLGALAAQVAPAIENAFLYSELAQQERLKHELEIARRIQMESLPQFTPHVEGLDIAGVSIPAFEVGGDYFDYLNGNPGCLTVMVGDVSGKGTSAALYMSKLQGIVRSLHVFDLTPHEIFVRTNDLLCRDLERRSFVTALGGFFDTDEHQMVLARAGHLPLYYFSAATGDVHRMLPRGMGFGLSNRMIFETELQEQIIRYHAGDVFLFITDGITESFAPSGDDFGEDRVQALLQTHASRNALEIRDHVTAAVRAFTATAEQFDDQTVVVVKATG